LEHASRLAPVSATTELPKNFRRFSIDFSDLSILGMRVKVESYRLRCENHVGTAALGLSGGTTSGFWRLHAATWRAALACTAEGGCAYAGGDLPR
jgi:hypothetical protein